MLKLDKENIEKIYSKYPNESLVTEYELYSSVYELTQVYGSIIIDYLDDIYNILLEEIAKRFSKMSEKIVYLKNNE